MAKRFFVTEELVEKMRKFEAEKFTRKQIAKKLNIDASTVTRKLGPVRSYRGARVVVNG